MAKKSIREALSTKELWDIAIKKTLSAHPYSFREFMPTSSENLSMRALAYASAGSRSDLLDLARQFPELLTQTLSDHSRLGAGQGSILDACLEKSHWGLSCDLIARGAWCAPRGISAIDSKTPFASRVAQLHESIAARARDALDIAAAAEALAASGRPAPELSEWAEIALGQKKIHLAADIYSRHGITPSRLAMDTIAKNLDEFCSHASYPHDLGQSRPCWSILSSARQHIDQRLSSAMWRECIVRNNLGALSTLVEWDVFPHLWMLEPAIGSESKEPLGNALCFAASKASHLCFAALREMPQAVEAARERPAMPETLARCAISDLASLARMAVPIDGKNSKGENFLHIWAREDTDKPRDGWRTLLKLVPGLDSPNMAGERPADIARASLRWHPKRLVAFEVLMAHIEKTQLMACSPAPEYTGRQSPRL
jgi:hypothetical protein